MAMQQCQRLRSLTISCAQEAGEQIEALCEYSGRLETLSLQGSNTKLGDIGLATLALHCPLLRRLTITACSSVTIQGVQHLLRHCAHLRHLKMTGLEQISFALADKIIEEYSSSTSIEIVLGFSRARCGNALGLSYLDSMCESTTPNGEDSSNSENNDSDIYNGENGYTHSNADDDDGDGDREEMRGKSAKAVRLRERARIAVIMEHPSARANIDAALRLALNTSLPATEACAVLDGMPKAAPGTGLADRMAQFGAQRPGAGAAPAPKGQAAIDQSWDAIAARAGVPRRIGAV